MSNTQSASRSETPALGSRENFWGEDDSDDAGSETGHTETTGTDPAEYKAHEELLALLEPICQAHRYGTPNRGFAPHFAWLFDGPLGKESDLDAMHTENREIELSEPELHIPKQHETGHGAIEYRQHRHRRRFNPETGYINWGESTATGLPSFEKDVYKQAVHNYLAGRPHRVTNREEYLQQADRFWHDQQLSALESLEKFIAYVRDQEGAYDE